MILWKHKTDKFKTRFSSQETWRLIREAQPTMKWYKDIWFTHNTPKYAFMAWLAVKNRLSTGGQMLSWNNNATTGYFLCSEQSRNHIFFTCTYSYTKVSRVTEHESVGYHPWPSRGHKKRESQVVPIEICLSNVNPHYMAGEEW